MASSTPPFVSNLNRYKIAVVYTAEPSKVVESENTADYYIAKRSLNPDLKYGIDFGPYLSSGGDVVTGGFYTNIIVPFAAWCLANNVQAVIVSCKCPATITFDDVTYGTYQGNLPGLLAASSYFSREGQIKLGTLDGFWAQITGDVNLTTHLSSLYNNRLDQINTWAAPIWFDNTSPDLLDIANPFTTWPAPNPNYSECDYGIQLHDFAFAKAQPSAATAGGEYYRFMASGRLGHPSGDTWVDNEVNTKRCIDDAIVSEARGWQANKQLPHHSLVNMRTSWLNGLEGAVWAHDAKQSGFNVLSTVHNGGLAARVGPAWNPSFTLSTTLQQVLDFYGVAAEDYDSADILNGAYSASKFDAFATFGSFLNNSTTGVTLGANESPVWQTNYNFLQGSYHLISTSTPSATLRTALAGGACAGIGGLIEPRAGNTAFICTVMTGLSAGLSLMESHYNYTRALATTHSFAAGDPLYTPYKRSSGGTMTGLVGLPDPYCDITYGDTVNLSDPWVSASNTNKTKALQWGRVYIDSLYSCGFDEDDPPDEIKTANAVLANYHLTSPLFNSQQAAADNAERGLISKSSTAGPVSTKKVYDVHKSKVDPYPDVTAMLSYNGVCSYRNGFVKPLMRR